VEEVEEGRVVDGERGPRRVAVTTFFLLYTPPSERERRLLLSWAKAGKDGKGRNKATRSEGDDLGDSTARALMRHGGRGRGGRG
jgi:hypothetical protein